MFRCQLKNPEARRYKSLRNYCRGIWALLCSTTSVVLQSIICPIKIFPRISTAQRWQLLTMPLGTLRDLPAAHVLKRSPLCVCYGPGDPASGHQSTTPGSYFRITVLPVPFTWNTLWYILSPNSSFYSKMYQDMWTLSFSFIAKKISTFMTYFFAFKLVAIHSSFLYGNLCSDSSVF